MRGLGIAKVQRIVQIEVQGKNIGGQATRQGACHWLCLVPRALTGRRATCVIGLEPVRLGFVDGMMARRRPV